MIAVVVGASIGLWRARVVAMTGMPELIALLHSFVGLAAVLVGWNGYLYDEGLTGSLDRIHNAEVVVGVFIGAVTFTGSIVANLKLSARIKSAPLVLPGKNAHQPRRTRRLRGPDRLVRRLAQPRRAHRGDRGRARARAGTWSPPSAAATCRSWCRC